MIYFVRGPASDFSFFRIVVRLYQIWLRILMNGILKKKLLDTRDKEFLFRGGEVWWCSVGLNIASESCGKGELFKRPVLVIKKLSRTSFIGVPLSTQKKVGTWFTEVTIHNEVRYVLLYQIRMFSTNRFERRLATLDDGDYKKVKEKLEALLELS